jgi:hypothetical protein
MLYMVIATHTPDNCPMINQAVKNKVFTGLQKSPDVAKTLGVTQQGSWTNLLSHTIYNIVDAPNAHAITQWLNDCLMLDWNTVTVEPILVTSEIMAKQIKQI